MMMSIHWSSHFPVLIKAMLLTDGPVLELGTGFYSTPLLHWMCFPQRRELVSYDSQEKYYKYTRMYEDESFHKVNLIKDEEWTTIPITRPWDVVLVDQSPSLARKETIKMVKDTAKYIVIHDSGPKDDRDYKYTDIYPLFKYKYEYSDHWNHTSILSNLVDLTGFEIKNFKI